MRKLIYTFTCVLFLIGLIIGIIEFRAYDRSFYAKEYTKLEIYEYIGNLNTGNFAERAGFPRHI